MMVLGFQGWDSSKRSCVLLGLREGRRGGGCSGVFVRV